MQSFKKSIKMLEECNGNSSAGLRSTREFLSRQRDEKSVKLSGKRATPLCPMQPRQDVYNWPRQRVYNNARFSCPTVQHPGMRIKPREQAWRVMRIRVGLCLPVAVSVDGAEDLARRKIEARCTECKACITAHDAEYKAEVTRARISTQFDWMRLPARFTAARFYGARGIFALGSSLVTRHLVTFRPTCSSDVDTRL